MNKWKQESLVLRYIANATVQKSVFSKRKLAFKHMQECSGGVNEFFEKSPTSIYNNVARSKRSWLKCEVSPCTRWLTPFVKSTWELKKWRDGKSFPQLHVPQHNTFVRTMHAKTGNLPTLNTCMHVYWAQSKNSVPSAVSRCYFL